MRYIKDTAYYDPKTGPILFYAGNEGDIWNFYKNCGFVTETLAKKYKAMVVFAEHRFYGTSMPFGADSFKKETGNLKYLNVQQALEDFNYFVYKFKLDNPDLKDKAVIAFGGSYGGMLAAWLRIKYAHNFQGALASSAPVLWYKGKTISTSYTVIASRVIKKLGG